MKYKLRNTNYTVDINVKGKEVKNEKLNEIDPYNNLCLSFLTLDYSIIITSFEKIRNMTLDQVINTNISYNEKDNDRELLAQKLYEYRPNEEHDIYEIALVLFKDLHTQNEILQVYREKDNKIFCTTLTIFAKLKIDPSNMLKNEIVSNALDIISSIEKS